MSQQLLWWLHATLTHHWVMGMLPNLTLSASYHPSLTVAGSCVCLSDLDLPLPDHAAVSSPKSGDPAASRVVRGFASVPYTARYSSSSREPLPTYRTTSARVRNQPRWSVVSCRTVLLLQLPPPPPSTGNHVMVTQRRRWDRINPSCFIDWNNNNNNKSWRAGQFM